MNSLVRKYLQLIFSAICFSMLLSQLAMAQTIVVTNPSPNGTNQYGQYNLTWTSTNNASKDMSAGVGTITITFGAATNVPASISSSLVTVNGTVANNVTVSGQAVTITTPVDIVKNGGTPGTAVIVISATAQIRNPGTATTYTLTAFSSAEPTPITSNTYTIAATTTTVTQAAVTPNPSVESIAAAYTIGFSTGSGGALTTSSTITLTFPSGTTVPNTSISGVTINGTSATASGNSSTRVVTITCPLDVDNNGGVTIFFSSGSGLINPTNGSGKVIAVHTSSETTDVNSAGYSISANTVLSFSAITLSSSQANDFSSYGLDFVVSSAGAMAANTDSFIVTFSGSTVVPSTISNSNVTVTSNGFSDNAAGITVKGLRVAIKTPIAIGNGKSVNITFASGANIQNPANGGNYTLSVKTVNGSGTQIDPVQTSNPYNISAATSTLTQASVSLSSVTPAATNVTYTFTFSAGSNGRLVTGTDSITIKFPAGTGYGTLTGTINGVTDSTLRRRNDSVFVTSKSSVSIANSGAITLVVNGITNPAAASYSANLYSSVEASSIPSFTYVVTATAAITVSRVGFTNSGVNQTSGDTIYCTGVNNLKTNPTIDYIRVIFPEGVTVPSSIATTDVSFTGGQGTPSSISISTALRQIDIYAGTNNAAFTSIIFAAAAGIVNPSVPSATYYKVTVSTTAQPAQATSPAYSITSNATSVAAGTVTATPNVISYANAAYQILFTPGTFGKLAGGTSAGSDSITIKFTSGATVVPASISAANVSVNGTACTGIRVVTSGAGGTVKVVVPSGVTLPASTQATVTFNSSAGLTNGGTAGNFQVQVSTDAEDVLSTQTSNLTIASSASLTITQVTNSPNNINGSAAYTIKFTTGSSGALAIGDTIFITFPTNTSVPSSIASSLITVNGTNLTSSAIGSGQKLAILTPVSILNIANATVSISSSAGILNPTTVATNWTLTVSTANVGGGGEAAATSPQYSTSTTTTTTTISNVTPSSVVPAATSVIYTMTFNTGANGRLLGGTSTITVTFPSGTNVASANVVDTVNTVATATAVVAGQAVTVTVPSAVDIGNSGSVTLKLRGITNPVAGNYTVTVATSVETGAVTSNSYAISNAPPVTFNSVTLGANTDTVNMIGAYTIVFRDSLTITAGSGTIKVTFPTGTTVPGSIATSNVTVNGTNASAVSTNSGSRQVTVTTPTTFTGATITLVLTAGAGIINAADSSTHALQVATSAQPTAATSPNYTIKATRTAINSLNVTTMTSYQTNVAVQWTWIFNTGLRGAMNSNLPDADTLFFNFHATASIPGTISPSLITVNGTAASSVTSSGSILKIVIPASVTIGNSTAVTVIIDSAANIQGTTNPVKVSAYTSVETVDTPSGGLDVSLPVELAYFNATQTNDRIILGWRTESEIENAYWILEKAEIADGQNTDDIEILKSQLTFGKLSTLRGQGTKTSATEYFVEDKQVEVNKRYAYRLADVAYDGSVAYHKIEVVTFIVPRKFSLSQNYPNPFNPTTTIKFELPLASKVSVKIYNILGQEVTELASREMPAGFHTVVWNGRNNRNDAVASGIYFYRMVATVINGKGKFVKTSKMTLLK